MQGKWNGTTSIHPPILKLASMELHVYAFLIQRLACLLVMGIMGNSVAIRSLHAGWRVGSVVKSTFAPSKGSGF